MLDRDELGREAEGGRGSQLTRGKTEHSLNRTHGPRASQSAILPEACLLSIFLVPISPFKYFILVFLLFGCFYLFWTSL